MGVYGHVTDTREEVERYVLAAIQRICRASLNDHCLKSGVCTHVNSATRKVRKGHLSVAVREIGKHMKSVKRNHLPLLQFHSYQCRKFEIVHMLEELRLTITTPRAMGQVYVHRIFR